MAQRCSSYAEFWPVYLAEHSRPGTRGWHYAGTMTGIGIAVVSIAVGPGWLIVLSFVAGYAGAWIGHVAVERNRPATFRHPIWSFLSDFRMLGLWLRGRLGAELARAGVAKRETAEA